MSALLEEKELSQHSLTNADPECLVEVIQQISTIEAKLRQFRKEQISDSETINDLTQLCSEKLYDNSIYENKVLQTSFADDRTRHFKQSKQAQLKHLFKEWALGTAIQGPREILESKTWTEFIVWTFFCISMIAFFLANLSLIIDDHVHNEVLYSINIEKFNPDEFGFLYCPVFWLDIDKVHKEVIRKTECTTHVLIKLSYVVFYHLVELSLQLLEQGYNSESDNSGYQRKLFHNVTGIKPIMRLIYKSYIDDSFSDFEKLHEYNAGLTWMYEQEFIKVYQRLDEYIKCKGLNNLGDLLISLAVELGPYAEIRNTTYTGSKTLVIRHNRVCHQILLNESSLFDGRKNVFRGFFLHKMEPSPDSANEKLSATVIPYIGSHIVDTQQETIHASENEVILDKDIPTFTYYTMQDVKVTQFINTSDFECLPSEREVGPPGHMNTKCEHECYSYKTGELRDTILVGMLDPIIDYRRPQCSALPIRPYDKEVWNISALPCPSGNSRALWPIYYMLTSLCLAAMFGIGCYDVTAVSNLRKKIDDMRQTVTVNWKGKQLCAYYNDPYVVQMDSRREICSEQCKSVPRPCKVVNLKLQKQNFKRENWKTFYGLKGNQHDLVLGYSC